MLPSVGLWLNASKSESLLYLQQLILYFLYLHVVLIDIKVKQIYFYKFIFLFYPIPYNCVFYLHMESCQFKILTHLYFIL
jgi:hypothetical protein